MKTKTFENKEDWFDARKGKITGSRLKDIIVKRGTGEKIGYYEIIAERIAQNPDGENPMDRGTRLEEEAIELFAEKTGKKVNTDLVIWERDDNASIAISPDGFINDKEAVEVKCLSSARHIEAYLTQKVPDEYEYQVLQYFIVNEKLEKLYFVFYDNRMPEKLQMFYLEIERNQEEVETYLELQKQKIEQIEEIITKLTF